jgi:Fur family transcriptional regulator, stress-responsive regulator
MSTTPTTQTGTIEGGAAEPAEPGSVTVLDAEPNPLLDRLRARGWRITPQRRAIVHALAGEHVHRTADQIHAAARSLVPEVSLATVYNTLNELVGMGEISAIHVGDGSARYDPKVGPDHHHLVCAGCGRMFDVSPVGVDALSLPAEQQHGMRIENVEITFRGRCPDCTTES